MAAVKAYLEAENGDKVECMFNPNELTITKANSWQGGQAAGTNAPALNFQSGQSSTLALSLTFDSTRDGEPVNKYTDKLLKMMNIDKSLPGSNKANNKGRPPWVQFHWGGMTSDKMVMERVEIQFTYFSSAGQPLRCKAKLSLKQWKDEGQLPLQNPTSSTPTLHTMHHLRPGETLDRVAARHYGDATQWRQIAEANGILDPLLLPKGRQLTIPEQGTRYRDGRYA